MLLTTDWIAMTFARFNKEYFHAALPTPRFVIIHKASVLGQSGARNWRAEHHNNMRAAENNCWLAKVRYELAMKMMKGYEPLDHQSEAEELNVEDIQRVFSC